MNKEEVFKMIFATKDIADFGLEKAKSGQLIGGPRLLATKSELFFVDANEFSKLCDYCLLQTEDKEYYDTIFIDRFIFKKSV